MIAWSALVTAALVASLLCADEVGWAKILDCSRRGSALKIYKNIVLTSRRCPRALVSEAGYAIAWRRLGSFLISHKQAKE